MEALELCNVVIKQVTDMLQMMASTKVEAGKPIEKLKHATWGEVTSLIGLSGINCNGNLALSFEKEAILSIASKMLMDDFNEVNEDVVDAVSEITNMLTGGVKRSLSEQGVSVGMATPIGLVGKGIPLTQSSGIKTWQVPFNCESGNFVVEVAFQLEV
jgi:chemotaxis protein CheX